MTEQPWCALKARPRSEMLATLKGVESVLVLEAVANNLVVSVPLLRRFVSFSIDQSLIEMV